VLALMQQEHAKRVKKDQLSAAKRALEMATCSTAATAAAAVAVGGSKKQKTLFQCARGASKAECDEARMVYADGLPLSLTESPYFRDMVAKVGITVCRRLQGRASFF